MSRQPNQHGNTANVQYGCNASKMIFLANSHLHIRQTLSIPYWKTLNAYILIYCKSMQQKQHRKKKECSRLLPQNFKRPFRGSAPPSAVISRLYPCIAERRRQGAGKKRGMKNRKGADGVAGVETLEPPRSPSAVKAAQGLGL